MARNSFLSQFLKSFLTAILFFTSFITTAQWKVETSGGSQGYRNAVRHNSTGDVYVVLQDASNSYKATVQKKNGASWSIVGAAGFSTYMVYEPSIAINQSNGEVFVTYIESIGGIYKLSCNKFDGSSWVDVGTPEFVITGATGKPGITIDNLGNPVIVTPFYSGFYVYQYNGSSWVNLTANPPLATPATTPLDILYQQGDNGAEQKNNYFPVVGSDGSIYVAVSSPYIGNDGVIVMKYASGAWTKVGNNLPGGSITSLQRVVFAPNGDMYVAYATISNSSSFGKIYVHKWNGLTWVDITAAGTKIFNSTYNNFNSFSFDIAFDSNSIPHVIFQNTGNDWRANLRKYNSSTTNWDLTQTVNSNYPGFAMDAGVRLFFDSNNSPFYVTTNSSEPKVFVAEKAPVFRSFSPIFPTSGAIGATTTLSGVNFTGTTDVQINGVSATYTIVDDNTITVTIPNGATSGVVSVTNAFGTTSTSTYTVVVPATITSFSPTSGSIGSTVTITGTNFTGATAVKFNGVAATTFTVVSATSITAVVPTGATTGAISVTTPASTVTSSSNFTVVIPPSLSSITPTNAEVGDVVTISGTGFDATASNNIVYFGNVQAKVNAATTTSLSVIVPNGSTRDFISVVTNGYVLYSSKKFNLINKNIGAITTSPLGFTSVGTVANIAGGGESAGNTNDIIVGAGDFDNDGWSDIFKGGVNNISVNRNLLKGTNTTLSSSHFSSATNYAVTGTVRTVAVADVDGDGKLDIITGSTSGLSILRNTSIYGSISFAAAVNISTSTTSIRVADFNYDGKVDIAAVSGGNLNIFSNNSTSGSIAFNSPVATALSTTGFYGLDLGDLNNDGKVDIVVSLGGTTNVIINNSTAGNLALTNSFTIAIGHVYVIVDDLDKDGKNDIYLYNKYLKNGYVSGTLTSANFTTYTNSLVDEGSSGSSSVDLNGDAYPEIFLGAWWSHLWLYINNATGTPTSIFSNRQTFVRGNAEALDINGDQKVDMITSNVTDATIGLTQNTMSPSSGVYATCSLNAFTQCSASPSTSQTISVSGTGLTSDISISAAPNFEYSLDNTTFSSSLTLPQVSGTVAATTVYVRYNRADLGSEKVDITISSSIAAGARKLIISAFGSRSLATISGNTSVVLGQTTTLTGSGSSSTSTPWVSSNTSIATVNSSGVVTGLATGNATITYTNLFGCQATQSITVVGPPTITSFTPTSGNNGTIVTITGTNLTGATVVKFNGVAASAFTVNSATSITATAPIGTTGTLQVVTAIGTATSATNFTYSPTIVSTGTLTSFSKCAGAVSSAQTFTVSGVSLTANLIVAAYTGLEYSLDDITYSSSLSLTPTAGTVSTTTIYVRMTAASASLTTGSISLTSTGATTQSILVAGAILTNQNFGNALALNGTGKIQFANQSQTALGNNFTVEAWVNIPTSATNIQTIVSNSQGVGQAGGFRFGINTWATSDGKIVFEGGSVFVGSSVAISKNVWQHVAVVVNNSVVSYYINGVFVGTSSGSFPALSSTVLTLGAFSDSQYPFNGTMDEVRIWNTPKTQQEILASMYTPLAGTETALIAYFNFNQGIPGGTNTGIANLIDNGPSALSASLSEITRTGTAENFVANTNPMSITGSVACVGSTVQLYHPQSGGTWSSASTSVATINSTGLVTCLTTGSSIITYTYSFNGCQFSNTYTLTVNAIPAAPTVANTSIGYCLNATATALTATATTGNTLKWYTVATGGIGSTTAITPVTTSTGVITYYVAQMNTSGCEGPRVAITVTVSPNSVAGTESVNSTAVCGGASVDLNLTGFTGTVQWQSSLNNSTWTNITGATTANYTTAALTASTYYRAVITSGACAAVNSNTLTVAVTTIPVPTVSTPTVQTFTTLGASTWTAPAGVTSVEYLVVGGAGGGATGYDNAGGGGGGAGMVLTGRLSVLPGTSYPIVIGDGGVGGANARANNWGVNGENSSFATITALGGNRGKGCRSIDIAGVSQSSNCSSAIGGGGSGGGFGGKGGGGAFGNGANNSAATGGAGGAGISSSITGTSVTYGIGGAGGNNGTVTTGTNGTANTGNGGKGGSALSASSAAGGKGGSGIVIIKYATQATTISYCQNQSALPLQATSANGCVLQWYTVATGGTASATAPTPNTSSTGSTIFYVSQKDTTNGCESARLAITVTVNSIPTAPTTTISSVDYCQSGTATSLAATGTSGNMLQWFLNSTVQPSCTPTPSTTTTGLFNYNAIQISSAGCESPATTIAVNVFANPTAPVVSNDTLCINSVASPLTATANSGNTLQWYTTATGGSATTTAFTPITSVSGTTNYYVSQKTDSTGCESPRSTIAINVPVAPYPYDRAVNFTAGGHLTKAANASINLTDWTVEAWIYPTAWNTLGGIVSKRDFQFTTNANGALSVMIERNWSWELATTANNVITLNKWQHVAASYNASTKVVKIYVDGVLVYTFTRSQTFVPDFNTYDFKVGYNNGQGNGTPNRTFAGNIDEVKVWNVDRTDSQISSNYTTELTGTENNLVAYYKFNQGVGGANNNAITSLTDLTANANHLTPASSSPVYAMNGASNNIIQAGPTIISSPSICLNTTTTLVHSNSGGTWYSSDTTVISIDSISGEATTLSLGNATITYSFISNGCVYTSTKLFTVLDVPSITVEPSSVAQNVCINSSLSALSVTATGVGLTYQWYKNTTASAVGGTLISGATSSSYTPLSTAAGTLYYYCIVSGTCSPSDTSNVSGGIMVSPASVAGTISGTSTICSGSSTTLTLSGNVGSSIQWQKFASPIWIDVNGETASTFTTPALTSTTTYRAAVTSGVCSTVYTLDKIITVNPLPVISGLSSVGAGNQITLTATTTAASSNAWVSSNTSKLTVSNLGVVTGIATGNASVIFTNNTGCKDTFDITVSTGNTLSPVLTSPATNTSGATTLNIVYTLPETPLAGSVMLTFTPVGGGASAVWTMNNATSANFNYVVGANPISSNVTAGSALTFTTYDVTLAYQDVYSNPASSVTNTNVQTLAPPAISFSNTTYNQVINVPISIQTINAGGQATYSISPSLPNGLVLNTSTGLISGTSTNVFNLTAYLVTASNAAGTDTASFNLFIDADTDGDGIGNTTDPDIDGDGINNGSDVDPDGDGVNNNGTDTDGDGINDSNDADIDGDGILNTPDSDVNGDGIIDNGTDADGDGINDANDPDIDGDGIPNSSDADANGDGVPDTGVTDTDGDGIVDSADADVNGDGVIDNGTDTDTDGVNDVNDPDIDGDGIPNVMDADSNGDGVIDNGTDTDGDGINDANDPDIDGDGILNGADVDVNGDGVIDNGTDTDNDGVNDSNDTDIDGDGIPNVVDADPDGDGIVNNGPDTDGDGINDIADADVDGDGTIDNGPDSDGDGINDANDPDIDGDGIPNGSDADVNGDGVVDNGVDTDGDGVNDANDTDIDGDGLANSVDNCPNVVNPSITTHPSTQLVNVCPTFTPPTLSVTAVGQDLAYQWYVNSTNSNVGGTLINGATDSTYVPSNTLVGPRYYYVVVNGLCGMSKSNISGVITIQDIINPTVVTQPVTVALNAQGTITLLASQVDNGSSDNCGVATLAVNPSQFNCSNIGANTVTLTVTDDNGNISSATAVVTVIDTIKPTVVTQNITVYLNTAGTVSITPAQIDNGSTDNCAIATMSLDITNFSCSNTGANTVTLTVTDVNGNIKTKTAIVTVVDSILPTVITQNAILFLNASGQASITAAQINNGSFDNCGVASVVLSQTAFTCSNVGSNTVTLTVTDTKGNVATGNAIVTIVDSTPPTAVVQNINAYLNTGGAVTITPSQVGGGSTDNCSIATMTLNNTTFNCSNLGPNAVVLTLVDPSNNVTTANATITVIDSVKPLLTIPSDITVFTNSGCGAFGFPIGTASASDNCSVISAITNNAPAFYPVGITNIQYSVTDGSGNTTIKIQKVTVIDNIIPVITAPANINTTLTAGCTKTGINLGTPVTSDNCTIASVTNDAPTAFPVGTTTVTWIVTDASGNTATATQTVTVTDAIIPTITAPSNITVNANSSCVAFNVALGTPVTADNCTVASVTNNAPAVFTLGTTTVTWTVTDASGNIATTIQTVTVVDNINPSIIAPAAITMNVVSGCSLSGIVLGTPFTLDNCSIATITNNAPTTFPVGTTTVVWTVTDGSGNIATANQLITIVDNINPTITAPAAITMNVVSGCSATGVVLGTPITADNCSVASVTNNAPATFPIGTTTVTWTVTDGSGKTATATQLVTILDNINPTITAPAAVSVNLTNGCAASNVVLGTPITADNCSVASITNNAPAIFQLGTTTVTWTVTDASGNSATSNQTVTVIDNINPTIVAPAAISMNVTSGCNVTGLALGTPFTADNCSVASVTNNAPTTFPIGTTTVVWTVTDGSGHTATANQLVTIVDNINPTITAPAAVTMNVVSGCSATGVVLGTPITADNCSVASVTNNAPATFPIGTTTVVWTVTDASGKTANATQLVTIVDNINPTITAPAAVSVNLTNGCAASNVVLGTPITADNCSVASVTNNAPAIFQLGTTTVTWTVTDASGLTATSNQTVTVIDNINPSIVAPAAISMNITSGCSVTGLALGTPYTADNCSVASVTNNAPTTFPIGTTTVIWTVTDGSGHTATATQLVTIIDNINPTITAPAAINSYIASGCTATGIVLGTPVTADNCSVASVTNNAPTSFPIGTTTVIWTVTDASGNTHTANQIVTVNDTLDPVITSPAAVTAYSNFGCQSVGVNLGTLTATDNCTIESITNNAPLFFPLGNTNVVWTVIDASGNSSTVTQLVTVVDTLKPTIIAPSNLEVASNTGCGASEISIGNPIVDDNCGVATINNDAPVVFVSGINIVTWTVTDNSGNVSTATQIVTVVDNVNPTAVLNNITVSLPVGSDAVITSDMIDNGSFDNCGNVTITLSQTNFNCDNLGNNTILVTVTDESGNFVSQSVVVTVNPSGIDLDLDGIDDACDQLIDQTVNVPNGFTPDGDGINDKFVIVGLDSYTSKALTIYNRYGNMVYETNNYQNDWDGSSNGSELPDGTYFYILELNGSETKSGYVYINRVH